MTKQEFIDKHKHELAGLVVDAATEGRKGADLALWLRQVMKRIDCRLEQIYFDLKPPAKAEPVSTNGVKRPAHAGN